MNSNLRLSSSLLLSLEIRLNSDCLIRSFQWVRCVVSVLGDPPFPVDILLHLSTDFNLERFRSGAGITYWGAEPHTNLTASQQANRWPPRAGTQCYQGGRSVVCKAPSGLFGLLSRVRGLLV